VDLVDGDGVIERQAIFPARRHPGGVVPGVGVEAPGTGGHARAHLGEKGERVGLFHRVAAFLHHGELVERAVDEARNVPGPDARGGHGMELVQPRCPVVEVADHGNAPGVGGPDREAVARAFGAVVGMRAEHAVEIPVLTLAEKVDVEFADVHGKARRLGLGGDGRWHDGLLCGRLDHCRKARRRRFRAGCATRAPQAAASRQHGPCGSARGGPGA
jgi:hypothetical protein